MNKTSYVIGVDNRTDSVRSVLVDAHNGKALAAAVYHYPRWKEGLYCNSILWIMWKVGKK